MKKLIVIAATVLNTSVAVAAENNRAETLQLGEAAPQPEADSATNLFGKGNAVPRKHAWYLAPTVGVTQMGSDAVLEGGLRGAYRLDRQYGIGLAAQGWEMPTASNRTMEGGFAGPMFEMVFWKDSLVHVTTQTVVGGGWYCASGPLRYEGCQDAYGFFAVDASLNLELNVSKNVHVLFGVGNRFAAAGDGPMSSGDLSGFVGRTSIALGQF